MLNKIKLKQQLQSLSAPTNLLVAFSGGVDSHVLLHLLVMLREQEKTYTIRACHINHGLSPNAQQWAEHCQRICLDLRVTLILDTVTIHSQSGESMEAIARSARYDALAKVLQPGEALLTAHNLDDQAETLLLQGLRGAGPRGLAAMPKAKAFSCGEQLRPLLDFTRAEIEAYATEQDLTWVTDESNLSEKFDRNYLRHQVVPLLKARWQGALTNLSRSAAHCAEAANCLAEYAAHDLALLCDQQNHLNVTELLKFNPARQRNILRHWLLEQQMPLPNTKKLAQIEAVLTAKPDATPLVQWDQFEVRRFQQKLYADKQLGKQDVSLNIQWDLASPLVLPGDLGVLQVERSQAGIRADLDSEKFSVRFRQGGERICLSGHTQHKTLKHCMQEWGVPPWLRERVPLLYHEESLVAVIGYGIANDFAVKTDGLQIKWIKR